METFIKFTRIKKIPHKNFKFYINSIPSKDKPTSTDFFSQIFNIPNLPLIGVKSMKNNNYHNLGEILSLSCLQINICQGKENNEIDQIYDDFKLPKNLDEYLNIDEAIEIDNNTDEPENNLFFMPKKKLNFYLIITELPEIEKEIKNKNEFNINNFNNEINEEKEEQNNANSINIINEEENKINNENNNYNIFNIIPHFFYLNNKEKDLLEIKNISFQKQITLYTILNKNYYDIDKDEDNNKDFIDINNLRAENSNISLDKNNKFVFIPDNLKFYLNIKNDISQFYLIYTSYEDDYHSVFYYITCNNKDSKTKMKIILNDAQNIKEVIEKMENIFQNKQIIYNLKQIFKTN